VSWASANPSVVIAALTAAGFVTGTAIVASFAAGLGVGWADFGLDLRASVTVAAGLLVQPALVLVVWRAPLARFGRGRVFVLDAIRAAAVAITMWWLGINIVVALVIGGGALVATSALELWQLSRHRPPVEDSQRHARTSTVFIAAFTFPALAMIVLSYGAGRSLRRDDGDLTLPRIVSLVLPVRRGTVTVGDVSVCVDRVGERVFIGADAAAVVPDWDGFVIEDCTRGDVSKLFG
jgi:hypothetical protein